MSLIRTYTPIYTNSTLPILVIYPSSSFAIGQRGEPTISPLGLGQVHEPIFLWFVLVLSSSQYPFPVCFLLFLRLYSVRLASRGSATKILKQIKTKNINGGFAMFL